MLVLYLFSWTKISICMEFQGLLPCSHKYTTGHTTEPAESMNCSSKIHSNIIFQTVAPFFLSKSVTIVIRPMAGWPENCDSDSSGVIIQNGSGAHMLSYLGCWGLFPRGKTAERDTGHSYESSIVGWGLDLYFHKKLITYSDVLYQSSILFLYP